MQKAFLISVLAIKQPCPAFLINWMALSIVAYLTLVCSEEIPSFTDDPLGKERWWINLYSPSVFLGTTPRGETRKGANGGDSNGPANLCNSSSFLSFASTTVGFCKGDFKLPELNDLHSPSKWRGKPWVKPESKRVAVEWKYPSRRKRKRSTFIGVGRLIWKGVGRLGPGPRLFRRATKITFCYRVGTFTFKTVMIVSTTWVTFLILVETKTITSWDRIQLGFRWYSGYIGWQKFNKGLQFQPQFTLDPIPRHWSVVGLP